MNPDLHNDFKHAATAAEKILEEGGENVTVFQVFECEHCGTTAHTMEANAFHEVGRCHECSKTTNLRKSGCGFIIVPGRAQDASTMLADSLLGRARGNA